MLHKVCAGLSNVAFLPRDVTQNAVMTQ